jgi:uncharacterized protein
VAEDGWPRADAAPITLGLGGDGRLEADATPGRLEMVGLQTAGLDAGSWCPYGEVADWPGDQRAMDGMSLTFTSDPLPDRLEILGYPEVTLRLESDRPLALVIVRLCEVWPDGASTVVTRALQNLTHRESDEFPEPLVPGEPFTAVVKLDAAGHAFAAGNRIRVGVSPTYWPWAWPSPEPVRLTVFGGESTLALPVREPRAEDAELPEFDQPEESEPLKTEVLRPGPAGRRLTHDLATGRVELEYDWEVGGVVRLPNGLEVSDRNFTSFSIVEGDPLSARVRSKTSGALGRGDWRTRCESVLEMTCDAESFHVRCTVRAWEGEKPAFEKTWKRSFPRDLV